jgi:beta-alanine degradation protein BauB
MQFHEPKTRGNEAHSGVGSNVADYEAMAMADLDPTQTDPDNYKVIFENDRVRVLDFRDTPGTKTKPHQHPDSLLLMLSNFRRRLTIGDNVREVTVEAGQAVWSPAQVHIGENVGTTDTHVVFVELKY